MTEAKHAILRNGARLHAEDIAYATSFTKALLSVHQLTTHQRCMVLLHAGGGAVIKGRIQIPPSRRLDSIAKEGCMYRIDMRP